MGFRVLKHRRAQGERRELMKAENKGNKTIYSQIVYGKCTSILSGFLKCRLGTL